MEDKKIIIGIIISVFVILLGSQFFLMDSIKKDFNSKLTILNTNIDTLNDKLDDNINSLVEDINSQNLILNKKLSNIEEESKNTDSDILDLIQESEVKSQQKLDEVKSDLENSIEGISVESVGFSEIVEDILLSVVSVITDVGQGSGVFIRDGGYIVTNEHVIRGALRVAVMTYDDQYYYANLIGYDSENDIALLKIDQDYEHLRIQILDDVQIGETVIALGNPGGLAFSVTEGIISAKRIINNKLYVQTDVPISPGNSGGPLVNSKKKLVGLNNFKLSGIGFEGLGFAIPAERVDDAVSQIIELYNDQQG